MYYKWRKIIYLLLTCFIPNAMLEYGLYKFLPITYLLQRLINIHVTIYIIYGVIFYGNKKFYN